MPTKIVNETTKVFKFYDLFDNDERNYCETTINVKTLLYENGNEYYDISYSYAYTNVTGIEETSHRSISERDDETIDEDIEQYDKLLPTNALNLPRTNPFYYIYHKRTNIESDSLEGVITVKNSMTDEMVKFLMMDYKDMDKHIGNTWCVQYKVNIMHSLALLWD
tara:strand:- start:4970 stop:5464 length:495 start_codon:yes stop_codon:yes gene_type:complete